MRSKNTTNSKLANLHLAGCGERGEWGGAERCFARVDLSHLPMNLPNVEFVLHQLQRRNILFRVHVSIFLNSLKSDAPEAFSH